MTSTTTSVLGKVVQHAIDEIETLPANPNIGHVTATCNEVAALCPVTHQPDLYTITIDYDVTDGKVIESKALKLFLWRYRDTGISCENLASDIAHRLTTQYGAPVSVHATQQSRGGIVLEATAQGENR